MESFDRNLFIFFILNRLAEYDDSLSTIKSHQKTVSFTWSFILVKAKTSSFQHCYVETETSHF